MARDRDLFIRTRRPSSGWRHARAAFAVLGLALCLLASLDLLGSGATAAQSDYSEPTGEATSRFERVAVVGAVD